MLDASQKENAAYCSPECGRWRVQCRWSWWSQRCASSQRRRSGGLGSTGKTHSQSCSRKATELKHTHTAPIRGPLLLLCIRCFSHLEFNVRDEVRCPLELLPASVQLFLQRGVLEAMRRSFQPRTACIPVEHVGRLFSFLCRVQTSQPPKHR